MYLYVQPALFSCDGPPPIIGEVVVALVDGQWSVGGSVRSLTSLEPLAMTALPGQQEAEGRQTACAFLSELLDVLEELHAGGPFRPTSGGACAGSPPGCPSTS